MHHSAGEPSPAPPHPTTGSSSAVSAQERRAERPEVPAIVIHQAGTSLLVRWLAALGWFGFMLCALLLIVQFAALGHYFDTTEGLTEKYHSLSKTARSKVAIIAVNGVIMTGDGYVKKQIDRVRQDEDVKAVVLRVDSPGGTVTGSDYILHHLNRLRQERKLPIVVSMGAIAASGGYYVAMSVGDQAESIYAEPTTTTGSIGVLIPHYDLSGLLNRFDVKDDTLATHPRKEMLSMTKPMSDDQRQILAVYLNEAFQRFKAIVKSGRPAFRKNAAALDILATGEVFTGPQAKERGLVDRIGFVEDAIDRAVGLAGLSKEQVRVVRFEAPLSLFSLAGLRARQDSADTRFSEALELSTPRAYYLWTTVPPLLSRYSTLLVQP